MDTTLSLRIDSKLKADAERTLDHLGLSMSTAMRLFLTHVVAQQALPFPVQLAPVANPLDVPTHVQAEVMLEQIASIVARLHDMEAAEPHAERRAEMASVRAALSAMRFQFDPYKPDEVMATVQRVGQYATALNLH